MTNNPVSHLDTAVGPRRCAEDLAQPWQCGDPRRDRTAIPYTDDKSYKLIDDAAYTLTIFRAPMSFGDAGAAVSVFVSLAVEAEGRLHDAVADARDQGYTWDEIARRLATSESTARRRYAAYATWRARNTPLDND
jgi:hypothetical protein